MIRALLVDDQADRANSIAAILPSSVECVWCPNAAIAGEQLRNHKWPILMLDHDLYHDSGDGRDVARMVAETQDVVRCFVFIHSQNAGGAQAMRNILEKFIVTVRAWDNSIALAPGYKEWLEFSVRLLGIGGTNGL